MKSKLLALGACFVLAGASGCGSSSNEFVTTNVGPTTDQILRQALDSQGVSSVVAETSNQAKVTLGQNLFFDKLLSGNRDISCATCHHPLTHTGDGLSLPIGTGGVGFGPARQLGINQQTLQPNPFVPRNAPEVFNRGQQEWDTMFWDMRISQDANGVLTTPAGAQMPANITSVLAAQAMFPVTGGDEMLGRNGDLDIFGNPNEIAATPDGDFTAKWALLMTRLLAIQAYRDQFAAAYPTVAMADLNFGHAAEAIAEFERDFWTGTDSPFDRYLRGDNDALTDQQKRGALLFYGKANCFQCHTGTIMTDQLAHNIASPQLGPGRGAAAPLDLGRGAETGNSAEDFAFRTTPLRNVGLTGPWFHNGAYTTLDGAVRHHLNAADSLNNYDVTQLIPALQGTVQSDPATIAQILGTLDPLMQTPIDLSNDEVDDLVSFLLALTDPKFGDQSSEIPATVPSGLPVSD